MRRVPRPAARGQRPEARDARSVRGTVRTVCVRPRGSVHRSRRRGPMPCPCAGRVATAPRLAGLQARRLAGPHQAAMYAGEPQHSRQQMRYPPCGSEWRHRPGSSLRARLPQPLPAPGAGWAARAREIVSGPCVFPRACSRRRGAARSPRHTVWLRDATRAPRTDVSPATAVQRVKMKGGIDRIGLIAGGVSASAIHMPRDTHVASALRLHGVSPISAVRC